MAAISKAVLAARGLAGVAGVAILLSFAPSALAQKFLPDDPIQVMPPPMNVKKALDRDRNQAYDFLLYSKDPHMRPPVPAAAINTLGEVPDSEWFTNRHARRRLSHEELRRGAGSGVPPELPLTVISGKSEGIMPGFRARDAAGRLYTIKGDDRRVPELATAAEVIVSKFFHAVGYNTPSNDIIIVQSRDLILSPEAELDTPEGGSRPMTQRDLDDILRRMAWYRGGGLRLVASEVIGGELIGPFKFEGMRKDDPNDIVPHEQRRDLRGLFVIAAWLNHTDIKANNSLDAIVEEGNSRFIRHYLLDFGSSLGSDGDKRKDPRLGNEFMLPTFEGFAKGVLALGLFPAEWEKADFPDQTAAGNLEAVQFDPEEWNSNYPNPAFLSRLPDDEYWAAKQVMAFTDDEIRTIVETGQFTEPAVVDYITATLAERRDRIGKTYFSKVLPLDNFRVESGELKFDDLAARHGFAAPAPVSVQWARFDNLREIHEPIAADSLQVPREAHSAADGAFFSSTLSRAGDGEKKVIVYLRKNGGSFDVVGIERTWPSR